MNDDNTEALLFLLKPSAVSLPGLITLGSHSIPFPDYARNTEVILDSKLSTKKHLIKICQLLASNLNTLVQSACFSLKIS